MYLDFCPMTWTRTRSLAPILAAALATASLSPTALADDCGDVDAQGTCLDAQTLVWCADETLMTVLCPQGEVCSALGDGASRRGEDLAELSSELFPFR